MVAIVDYGVGNLFSLRSSLSAIGAEVIVTSDVDELKNSDQIILPGVGAFEDAANNGRCTQGRSLRAFIRTDVRAGNLCRN